MFEWWEALGNAGQVFACIAIPATVMLLLQLLLTLFGLGGDNDVDDVTDDADIDDIDGDNGDATDGGLRIFTFRGVITFFSVLGWVGVICCDAGLATPLSIVIATLSGAAATCAFAFLMMWLLRLQYDGTEDIRDALGVSGTVYMRIPPSRSGKGKISAIIQGKLCEKNAVTDEETLINCGEEVTVVGISGEETLIVKRKNKI